MEEMTENNCPICFGIGLVCENHPGRAWHVKLGCMCGAGMPCKCNKANGDEEPDTTQVIVKVAKH